MGLTAVFGRVSRILRSQRARDGGQHAAKEPPAARNLEEVAERRRSATTCEEALDAASEASFPASDPPSSGSCAATPAHGRYGDR